jgi:hypothetical protein
MSRAFAALALAACAALPARGEEPIPPPPIPSASPPQAPAPKATIDTAELQRMIDDAVRRAVAAALPAASPAAAPSAAPYSSPQTQAAYSSPQTQAAYSSPQAQAAYSSPQAQAASSPTVPTQMLVAAGPLRSCLARCGRKLANLDQPRLKTVHLAASSPAIQYVTAPPPAQYYQPALSMPQPVRK